MFFNHDSKDLRALSEQVITCHTEKIKNRNLKKHNYGKHF